MRFLWGNGMILNELQDMLLRENDDYNYFDFGFEVDLDNIDVDNSEYLQFSEMLSGNIDGELGELVNLESVVYDTILSVTGQLKLPNEITFESYKKTVGEIALYIYNHAMIDILNASISDIHVNFLDDTDKF